MTASLSLLLLATSCSSSEHPGPIYTKVLPGDLALHPERLRPHSIRYKKLSGSMYYEMDRVTIDDRSLYKLDIYFNSDGEGVPDSIYFDPETLGYSGRHLELQDYTIDVQFQDGYFTGNLIPAEGSNYDPVTYDKQYEHGAFEPAVINYFIAALPLAEGYTASIPTFDLSNGSQILWANIEVLGKEILEIDGIQYNTWKVISDGIRQKTLWISEDVPYAIKMQTKGVFGTWEIDP